MQTRNPIFDDIARVFSGAVGAASGMRSEVEARIRAQLERLLADMDLVTREEYEAVEAMAAKAREEQEALAARVAALEAQLAAPAKRATKAAAKPAAKTAAKSAAKAPRKTPAAPRRKAETPPEA